MLKLINPLWLIENFLTLCFSSPDPAPAAPTQTNVQNSNLPEYVKPYVETMLGTAQKQVYNMDSSGNVTGFKPYTPYSTDMNNYVAGFSPLQQSSFQGAANLQTPGQFQAGSQLAGASGLGSLGVAGQAGAMGQAGNQYNSMATNPYATQAFMNPYVQNSLQPQLNQLAQQGNIASNQAASQAAGSGAFGGTRSALAQNLAQQNALMAQQSAIGQGYNNAYNNAIQSMQFGSNLGLQGQQAAAQAALQGYGQANQAAGTLGQLGQQQLTGQEGILGLQNAYGGQQQQAEQTKINQAIQNYATAQQYPMMQLGNISNLLHGLPLQSTTTQTYQASPSTLNTLAGLGTGIAGAAQLLKAKGGTVKSYVGGGITSLANRERIAANYTPQALQQEVKNGVLPQQSSMALAQDYANYQKAAEAAKAAAAMQQQQPSIASADSGMPTQMAGGGIVAFSTGNVVNAPKFGLQPADLEKTDTTGLQDILANYMNKDTNRPYTEEEIAAKRRAKEGQIGIKDTYEDRQKEFDKTKADIEDQKKSALGFGLLNASSKILENANKPGLGGIGAGLGGFTESYAPALKDIRANEASLRKEKFLAEDAHTAMLQARMNGDDKAFTDAQNAFATHKTNIINAENQDRQARNAVRTEGAKEEYAYGKDMQKQLLENFGKVEAAKITSGNADIGHINQAIFNSQSALKEAKAQHETAFKPTDVKQMQSLVDNYNQTIANKGTPSASQIANKERAEKYLARASSSENNIKNLEAKYKPYIEYIANQAHLPPNVVQSLSGKAIAPDSNPTYDLSKYDKKG